MGKYYNGCDLDPQTLAHSNVGAHEGLLSLYELAFNFFPMEETY